MAVTSTASHETTNEALSQKLWSRGEPTLLANTVLWQLGTEALLGKGEGVVAHIPTYANSGSNGVVEQSLIDGSATVSTMTRRALDFGNRTIQLRKYRDNFVIEDIFSETTALDDYIERGALFLMQGMAQRMETYVMDGDATAGDGLFEDDTDSGETNVMWTDPADDGSTHDTVVLADELVPEAFFASRRKLRKKNAQGFASLSNKFAAIIGPEATYKLQTNTNSSSLTFEESSMNMTDVYKDAQAFPSFAQTVFLETTHGVKEVSSVASNEYGLANAVNTAEILTVLAADAFYTTRLTSTPAQFKFNPFGDSKVADDMAHEWASIAIKAFFGYKAGDRANKQVIIPMALT